MRRHDFFGGLRLAGDKAALAGPIRPCPLPPQLAVPLRQHAGEAAEAAVAVGETVRRGQRLGRARGTRSVPVHSPAAGRVLAIESRPLPGDDGPVPHVLIAVAGDAHEPLPPLDWRSTPPAALLQRMHEAGIVGLGGAGFPSAEKLAVGRHTLILNGAECEPHIACDEALLRERAEAVVLGGRALARIVGAGRILLAVEDDMHAALAACGKAIAEHGEGAVELVAVPNRYPQGGERQLIQTLTGQEVPRGGLPRELGLVVHNVGTAAAAWQAIHAGEPLTRRIVTVSGKGVARPGNFEVAIGTPIAELIAAAGGYTDAAARLLLGGPLMGIALPHDAHVIGKTSNCVLVLAESELRDPARELPCIRCGDCASVCPARLLPQQLLAQVRGEQLDAAQAQGLDACIECGACDLACPSAIPLSAHFRFGKRRLRQLANERTAAADARQRHLARQQRLLREAQEHSERLAARKAEVASADAVAAALARARAKRQSGEPGQD